MEESHRVFQDTYKLYVVQTIAVCDIFIMRTLFCERKSEHGPISQLLSPFSNLDY